MTVRCIGAIVAVAIALFGTRASAQGCDDGRVRVSGHCCWPGQTWSASDRVCDGAPQCPPGMSEEGEDCEVRAVAPSAPIAPVSPQPTAPLIRPMAPGVVAISPIGPSAPAMGGTSATTTAGWPELPSARPEGVMDPILRRGTDDGLVFGGLITFGVGYIVGLGMGIADMTSSACVNYGFSGDRQGCESGALAFVPIVGAPLSNTLHFSGAYRSDGFGVGMGLGIPMGVVQLIGLWIFLHGVAGYTLDIDEAQVALGDGASLRFAMSAPSSDAGLSAIIDF